MLFFFEGKQIKITAEAFDMNGSKYKVDFSADNTKFGITTIGPSINRTSSLGGYCVTAVTTDNKGGSTTSQGIIVNSQKRHRGSGLRITEVLIPFF